VRLRAAQLGSSEYTATGPPEPPYWVELTIMTVRSTSGTCAVAVLSAV
jgi:hypothetical protein